ncbi:response regulator [Psychromonas marina]|uniref:Response regulator n=1 Tax=Psychromonas marina TaxID=88364 RepID=A0ABQ6DXA1_9GAMM|nr:response regulator [Psychromonas marina]GLS89778.1 response regulator [Psychromonas marina]
MFSYENKRFLIVDDQKPFHVMLKTMLTNQGAKRITFADSAESAARLAQRKTFDIYLIDYNLGSGKNGAQLLDYLRHNQLIPKSALCFIITGDNNKGMVLSAIEKAPDDYMMKPFSQTQLFNRLSKADQKKSALSNIFDALNDEKYDQAIMLCKSKIETQSKFSGLCKNLLADIYITTKAFSEAERLLSMIIEKRPLVRACITLGKVYCLQHKYHQAITVLKEVLHNNPLQMHAYQWLARAYQGDGELNKALSILTHAANLTHHSLEKHQQVALLAHEMEEHKVIITSYQSILQISRNSFYPDPCHLANYIRSLINFANTQEEMFEKKTILKKVNSTLYQSRFEEGRNKNFDFNSFDEICQANVFFSLGELLKAKRRILNTLGKIQGNIEDFDNTLLYESLFSLLDIGEFDYAAPYLAELEQRDIIDPSTQLAIRQKTGNRLEQRMDNFKAYNKLGIQEFEARNYNSALKHFNRAIEFEPLNSGALLNRIHVYILILKQNSRDQRKQHIINCQSSFKLLSNTQLPPEHAKRYKELQAEFTEFTGR